MVSSKSTKVIRTVAMERADRTKKNIPFALFVKWNETVGGKFQFEYCYFEVGRTLFVLFLIRFETFHSHDAINTHYMSPLAQYDSIQRAYRLFVIKILSKKHRNSLC